MQLGANIRSLRKEKKATQEDLAGYLHVSAQAVSKWETGASVPELELLPRLAIFFGVSLDRLLDFDQSQIDAEVTSLAVEYGKLSRPDPKNAESFIRKALERYPNSDLLLTCLLENLQMQNADGSRSAEILTIGERVLTCTQNDEMRIDVLRILAETYRSTGDQEAAEACLHRIPALNFLYYEICASVQTGRARRVSIELTERLCIEKLFRMLALRKEDAIEPHVRSAIDRQAHELFAFLKIYPTYREAARIMERHWDNGKFMQIYQ